MHLGGGRHSGPHHSMLAHPSFQSSIHGMIQGDRMGMEEMRIP